MADKVRSDPARWGSIFLIVVASAAFAAWLLNFSRHQWFVTDDFDYFNYQHQSLIVWLLRPHNEHTIVFTKAWYVLLGYFVGLRYYLLYMIPIVACHLVVVATIYRLTWRATNSRVVTTGVALVALAMGAAIGTLTWAGQLQYVGSVAAGLIVLSLALENSGRRALALLIVTAVAGTLNGSAFVAFGLAACIVYGWRRLWPEAILVAAIPLGWEAINRLVWAPADPYAATGIGQIVSQGPSFAYSILDTAISKTLHETHLSAVVLAALALGTLALILVARWRRTTLSGRVVASLALAAILTMLSLLVARLSLPAASSSGGQYSYLFLVSLVPMGGILLAHVARPKIAVLGIGAVLLAISLVGAHTFYVDAVGLQSWKTNGGQLLQTAAAELNAGMPTYQDQIPVPDTAPTVTQERLRSLAETGQLDVVIVSPLDVDQVSLNMQWQLVASAQTPGVCRDLAAEEHFAIPVGTSPWIAGLSPGAAVDLRYAGSAAVRQFAIPGGAGSLESVSRRPALATVAAGSVRVCSPG
jgi:hypothetical protein